MMRIGVLNKGDSVINVTADFIAVRRKNGEVDLLPLHSDETGVRIETSKIITIGYGSNTIQVDEDGISITTF